MSILLATSPNRAQWDPMWTFVAINCSGLCCIVSILRAPSPNKAQWDPMWTLTLRGYRLKKNLSHTTSHFWTLWTVNRVLVYILACVIGAYIIYPFHYWTPCNKVTDRQKHNFLLMVFCPPSSKPTRTTQCQRCGCAFNLSSEGRGQLTAHHGLGQTRAVK